MSKPILRASIDLGYLEIEIETTANNIDEPMIEIREGGHSFRLTLEGACLLADTLKAAANSK